MLHSFLTEFKALPVWLAVLAIVYAIYFFVRAYNIWEHTRDRGIRKGYRRVFFGYGNDIRIYHLIRIVFDIPPAIVGLLFPLVRKIFALKIYTFKKQESNQQNTQG